jgi:hypothetical protein
LNRQVPWLRVFVEGVVIVGSILMAFGLQAWWDGRVARARERDQLQALRIEFHEDLSTLDGLLESVQRHGRNVDALVALLRESGTGQVTIPDSLLGSVVTWRTSDISTSAFDAIVASGNLDQISDPELLRGLATYPAYLLDLREDEEIGKVYVEYTLGPFLAEQGLASVAYASRRGNPGPMVSGETNATVTPMFAQMLAARRVHINYSERGIPLLQEHIRFLIGRIDAQLGDP